MVSLMIQTEMNSIKDEKSKSINSRKYYNNFTETQKQAFEYIQDNIESDIQLKICVTGEAGTGKSYLIEALVALFQENYPEKKFALLASTGCAAVTIQGQTVYNFLKMDIYKRTSVAYRTFAAKFIAETEIIIIDEFSMIDVELFDWMRYYLRKFCRKEYNDGSVSWGGRHIILVGDPAQLPPIGKQLFRSNFFIPEFKFIRLRQAMRQENQDFQRILSCIRLCNYKSEEVQNFLLERSRLFADKFTIREQVEEIITNREFSKDPKKYEDLMIITPKVETEK